MGRRFCLAVVIALVAALLAGLAAPLGALAASQPPAERGLLITPTQDEAKVPAGITTQRSFVVANLTKNPITVNLFIKQFSVANYTYDYSFSNPHTDWLKLGQTQLDLAPNKSQTIPYTITPNASAAPGGYYYTLFASSKLTNGGVSNTVQAASLLYLTVNGHLSQSGDVEKTSIPRVVFGKQVNFSLDAVNTGNVYYTASVSAKIHGLFVKQLTTPVSHILIPHKIRTLGGSIPSPLLPGIYRVSVGYVTENSTHIEQSRWILYVPFWFLALLAGGLLMYRGWRGHRRGGSTEPSTDGTSKTEPNED